MTIRAPGAGLVSFNGINFVAGRSKLGGNTSMAAPSTHSVVAGQGLKIDRAGSQKVPGEYLVVYEYLIACGDGLSLADVQTKYDELYTMVFTNPVGTLVTFGVGDSTDTISGTARLEAVVELDGYPTYKRLNLTFFCELGLS